MSALVAAIRPTEWNLPLFVHVVGAMILVGGLLTGASAMAFAHGSVQLLRFGYWTLVAVALPGYVLMRIGGEWSYVRQGWDDVPDDASPAWISIGYIVADAGALLVLVALILGGVGVRRLRDGKGTGLLKAAMVISWVVLAAALVAVWAMSGKPS